MNTTAAKLALARVVGVGFILIGSSVAIAGLIWLVKTATFVLQAAKAPGTITAMERSTSSKGGLVYYPVFTFSDTSGITRTQRTSSGSSLYTFAPGDKVTVLYESAAPQNAEIDSFKTVWLGPLFITGFGLLFAGFACFWLFLAQRGTRLEQQNSSA